MFESISLEALDNVTGGKAETKPPATCARPKAKAASFTCVRDRHDPRHPDRGHNTGITGGMNVTNNDVPKPHNTGITGGMDVPNNDVP